ncbi:putative SOS response-associated peptidase YedK [compost metagenome]
MKTPAATVAKAFGLIDVPELAPRFNIAPTQAVAVVRADAEGRRLDMLRWGLIPSWVKDAKQAPTLVNARVDTLLSKPSFRGAFRSRRCLIPADGFYEWKTILGKKQPMYFSLNEEAPFALAGLWERWEGPDGTVIESCTTLTTEPNAVVSEIHDRMPVIVPPDAYALWLDPRVTDPQRLMPLLASYPAEAMRVHPVSPRVNAATAEGPDCIEPVAELAPPPQELRLF